MYSNRIQIQPCVPRFESIKTEINNNVHHWGMSSFYMFKVPYGFSQSRSSCLTILSYIVKIAKNKPHQPLHVYEFGAGMGLLAAAVLAAIKTDHPEIYNRLTFHISDIA